MTTTHEELAAVESRAAQLRAQVEADQAAASRRVTEAQAQWDRDFMASWEKQKEQAQAEQQDAAERFRQAVLADPVCQAYIHWRAARYRVMAVHRDATNIGNTSGADNTPAYEMTFRFPDFLEALVPMLEQEAGKLGESDSEQRWEERAQVAEAARANTNPKQP
ncbi:hypothetical protein AB0G04_02560 [Actinoplanes sp. NPDC023801]|uniref:hypothetical protein n=1 Tax=Actinoplanes sp. NPDC023801 TaxID=3154595 RepID=UPI003410E644